MLRWCRGVRKCFELEYLRQPTHQNIVTQNRLIIKIGVGLIYLVALTACIGNGNYVMLLCNGPIKRKTKICPSSWKLFVIIGCEFDIHSLAFQGGTMI